MRPTSATAFARDVDRYAALVAHGQADTDLSPIERERCERFLRETARIAARELFFPLHGIAGLFDQHEYAATGKKGADGRVRARTVVRRYATDHGLTIPFARTPMRRNLRRTETHPWRGDYLR